MDVREDTIVHRGLAVRALRAAGRGDGPVPGVLLVHDAWSLDDDAAALADAIAAGGFAVLAPDLLAGRRPADAAEAHAFAADPAALDRARAGGRRVEIMTASSGTDLAPLVVEALAAHLGRG